MDIPEGKNEILHGYVVPIFRYAKKCEGNFVLFQINLTPPKGIALHKKDTAQVVKRCGIKWQLENSA